MRSNRKALDLMSVHICASSVSNSCFLFWLQVCCQCLCGALKGSLVHVGRITIRHSRGWMVVTGCCGACGQIYKANNKTQLMPRARRTIQPPNMAGLGSIPLPHEYRRNRCDIESNRIEPANLQGAKLPADFGLLSML